MLQQPWKVFVYFNLHKKVWSVKALTGDCKGRVISHSAMVSLINVEFRVSEAGRQRVIREGRKNVHAGVVGYLASLREPPVDSVRVSYNPKTGPSFVDWSGKVYVKGHGALLTPERKVFVW